MGLRQAVLDRADATPQTPRTVQPAEWLGYAGLGLVLAAVVMLSSRGYFTPDIKPEVYLNPLRRLSYDLSAWQPDPQLGLGNYNNGLAPVSAVMALLHAVGLSAELMARLLRLTLLGLGAWGSVRLYRAVAGSADVPAGRLTMAAVFLFNPYAVVGGATLAVLLPYCVFPWQLLVLIRALQAGGGWKWPAAFALTFFAMSGMNVAAVPVLQLVVLPAVVLYVRQTSGQPWPRLIGTVVRCLGLSVLVSAYWWVPAVAAFGWGSTVASNSESVEGISAPSSFAEVLRGLGLWPMYGRNIITGPWTPGFVPYLTSVAVVGASFLLVALAAVGARLSASRARLLAVTMLALAAVVMVGVHPPGHPSPFGRFLVWVFDTVPGAVALRTTNKAGAGLALAVALLVALGASQAVRLLSRHAQRVGVVLVLALVVFGAGWPAFAGTSYVGRWKIPAYWDHAAGDLDADHSDSRVWFLPGQVLAHYRWNTEGVDDLNLSLLDRPSLLRTVLPVSSPETTNLLAGADSALQAGRLGGQTLSILSRYLGVDQVLLRNDTVWEDARGGRPSVIQPQVAADPGLKLVATYGTPGQNTATLLPGLDQGANAYEALVAPLQRYAVRGARGIVRTESRTGTVLLVGDGFAVPQLVNSGLLEGQAFRYVGDLSSTELSGLLGPDQRIVLTDSNRRRAADEHHLTDAYGPVLTAEETPTSTRALFGADAQTVARWYGISGVTASSFGSPFDVSARGAPDLAVDGDPSTAWTFGGFGTATEQSLTLTLAHTQDLGTVTVRTGPRPGPVRITALRVEAGGRALVTDVDAEGVARFPLTGVVADRLTVSVAETSGDGYNLVEITEVEVPGIEARKVARLPQSLTTLTEGFDAAARARLASTPLDVVLQRERGSIPAWDEERALERDFTLPDHRNFRVYGVLRTAPGVDGLPAADPDGCQTVTTLDGAPVRVRPLEEGVSDLRAVLVEGCDRIRIGPGEHRLRSVAPWVADTLVLRDLRGETPTAAVPTPAATVKSRTTASLTVTTPAAARPYVLVLGQSLDPRWQATMDGKPMGAPFVVDGYSAAYEVEDLSPHTFTFTYRPQRLVDLSRAFTALVLAMLVVLAARRPSTTTVPVGAGSSPWQPALPSRRRLAVEAVAVVALATAAGGIPLLPVAVALGVAHWLGRPRPRRLIAVSVGLLLLVPVVWIAGNADAWGDITPALVVDTPLPGWFAAAALCCLVVGVVGDDRQRRRPAEDGHPG